MSQISDQINSLFLHAYYWMQLIFIFIKKSHSAFKSNFRNKIVWKENVLVFKGCHKAIRHIGLYVLLHFVTFHCFSACKMQFWVSACPFYFWCPTSSENVPSWWHFSLLYLTFDSLRKCGPTDMLRQIASPRTSQHQQQRSRNSSEHGIVQLSFSWNRVPVCSWLCWVLTAVRLFSPVESGGCCPVGPHGLCCSSFSCWPAVALGHMGLGPCSFRALEYRVHSCGAWVWLLFGMWDLPWSGTKPVSLALAGGFFTTEPPGKPLPLVSQFSVLGQMIHPWFGFFIIKGGENKQPSLPQGCWYSHMSKCTRWAVKV